MNNVLTPPGGDPINLMAKFLERHAMKPTELLPAKHLEWNEEELTESPLGKTPGYKFALKELTALVPAAEGFVWGKSTFGASIVVQASWANVVRSYDFSTRAKRKAFANMMHRRTEGAKPHSYVNMYVDILVKRYGHQPKVMLHLDSVLFMEMLVKLETEPQLDFL